MVYTVPQVRALLGLRQSSLRREIREGRLSVNKRCGKYFFLGSQLLNWLRGGEVHRCRPSAASSDAAAEPRGKRPAE
jgi:hypothetical protein